MHNHCQHHLQRCVHNRETSSQWVKTSENKIQMNIAFKNYIICHLTLSEDLLIEIIHLNQKLPQAVIPYCAVFRIYQEFDFSATRAGCQRRRAGVISPMGIFKLKHPKDLYRGNAGCWEGGVPLMYPLQNVPKSVVIPQRHPFPWLCGCV